MAKRHTPPVMVSAVVERTREGMREVLIVQHPGPPYEGKWVFPFGAAEPREAAEVAIRRILETQLGLHVHIQFGQPPFDHSYDNVTYRWRFLFGEAGDEQVNNRHYDELRWVPRQSLREYEFDPVSQQVVDWMLEE